MTEYWLIFLSLLLTDAEIFAAVFVFTRRFDGRNYFALRFVLSAMGTGIFTALVALLCFYLPAIADLLAVALYVLFGIVAVLCAWFCYRTSFRNVVFFGSVAVTVRHLADQTARTICLSVFGKGMSDCGVAGYAMGIGIFAVALGVVAVIFYRTFDRGVIDRVVGRFSVFLFPAALGVTVTLDLAGLLILDFGVFYSIAISVCGILYGAFMLFAECAFMIGRQSEAELAIIKSLWKEDKKHYEMQKESIELINIKCHDLRHQVRRLRERGTVSEQAMEEIENSIYIYDSMLHTGNKVLDVVMSDYALRCQKSGVSLTCMADGEKISFMNELDVYSLFGNMLENALEYEQTVPCRENRFISLTVRETDGGGNVNIHAENHYEGAADDGASLRTHKNDAENHGFGIKSMRRIVEKYGGSLDILMADDMFQVDILLRAPSGGKGTV